MYHNLGHSEFSWKGTKIGKLLGDFIKPRARGWTGRYRVHSLLSLPPTEYLHRVPRFLWISLGLAFAALAWVKCHPMNMGFSHWIFYLIPVFILTCFSKRWVGIMISTIYAFALFVAEISLWFTYSPLTIPSWSAIARLASFLILALTLSSLKSALKDEKLFSRMDWLTGVGNWRYFNEWAEMEIHRAQRYKHPFTIIYIDLDDFKMINDHFGHGKGDHVLREVAQAIRKELRSTDKIARLGGDEFVVLLPETGFEAAEVIFSKIQRVSAEISEREARPITFSMGGVTFTSPPLKVDEIVQISDHLMYCVKNNGKNGIRHRMYPLG